jgi:hypothetical protein
LATLLLMGSNRRVKLPPPLQPLLVLLVFALGGVGAL